MLALTWDGRAVRLSERARPGIRPDRAIVRVRLAGICNTDLEIMKGYMGFRGTLGHEFVGIVDEGPPAWRGRRVVGEINFACGTCPACRTHLGRHCASRQVMGILDADGSFAEFVVLPIANLHAVPDAVPDEAAVFTEPLAAAFEILEQWRQGLRGWRERCNRSSSVRRAVGRGRRTLACSACHQSRDKDRRPPGPK